MFPMWRRPLSPVVRLQLWLQKRLLMSLKPSIAMHPTLFDRRWSLWRPPRTSCRLRIWSRIFRSLIWTWIWTWMIWTSQLMSQQTRGWIRPSSIWVWMMSSRLMHRSMRLKPWSQPRLRTKPKHWRSRSIRLKKTSPASWIACWVSRTLMMIWISCLTIVWIWMAPTTPKNRALGWILMKAKRQRLISTSSRLPWSMSRKQGMQTRRWITVCMRPSKP